MALQASSCAVYGVLGLHGCPATSAPSLGGASFPGLQSKVKVVLEAGRLVGISTSSLSTSEPRPTAAGWAGPAWYAKLELESRRSFRHVWRRECDSWLAPVASHHGLRAADMMPGEGESPRRTGHLRCGWEKCPPRPFLPGGRARSSREGKRPGAGCSWLCGMLGLLACCWAVCLPRAAADAVTLRRRRWAPRPWSNQRTLRVRPLRSGPRIYSRSQSISRRPLTNSQST